MQFQTRVTYNLEPQSQKANSVDKIQVPELHLRILRALLLAHLHGCIPGSESKNSHLAHSHLLWKHYDYVE